MGEETTRRVMELAEERADDARAPLQSFEEFVSGCKSTEQSEQSVCQWEHRLRCLEKNSQISMTIGTASRVPMGSLIKKALWKAVSLVVGSSIREQNRYNLELADIIRDMQQEITLLNQKIKELQEK